MDFYQLLELSPQATTEEIQAAFQKKARLWDPTQPGGKKYEAVFNQLLDAYSTLSHPEKRAEYDRNYRIAHPETSKLSAFFEAKKEKIAPKSKTKTPKNAEKKQPTFSQLLDFDWEALEEPQPPSPGARQRFWDNMYFKIIVVAVVLVCFTLIFWLINNARQ